MEWGKYWKWDSVFTKKLKEKIVPVKMTGWSGECGKDSTNLVEGGWAQLWVICKSQYFKIFKNMERHNWKQAKEQAFHGDS